MTPAMPDHKEGPAKVTKAGCYQMGKKEARRMKTAQHGGGDTRHSSQSTRESREEKKEKKRPEKTAE
jgi:hypothetical protein